MSPPMCPYDMVNFGQLTAEIGFRVLAALLHGTQAAGVTRQPNFPAWYKEWNYGTFAEGDTYIRQGDHHVGHWPTF